MSNILEKKWKTALTSILEELDKSEYNKMLFCYCFDKIPKSVKTGTSREEIPQIIIQHLGVDESVSAINEAMDLIPRKDSAVQDLLRPFVDKLSNKHEEENRDSMKENREETNKNQRLTMTTLAETKDQLKSSQPDKWKTSLTSILDELDDREYKKMLLNLDKIPKGLKASKSKEEMPQIIIQYYGVEQSVLEIKDVMDLIPRMDAAVQDLLRPFVDQLKKKDQTMKVEEPCGQSSKPGGNKHFVDEHRVDLIQRVTNIEPILDELLGDFIQTEAYNKIRAKSTSQEKMRELYNGTLKAGEEVKDIFYKLLEKYEGCLVRDIKKKTKHT
ncbi:apoptosis-associated speck-like protein containing a CARD isoform X3 [Thunnus thynnus]|uniref:apoptosis-associated speck-like protein containing a CARD isoform X3 n=1 Tax=Thunnus thynnus TaxID=8237 RepID=UPI003526E839